MKKSTLLFVIIIALTKTILAQNLPVKNQDVSPKQLKLQNKQITQLVAKELSKNLPQKIDKYTSFTKIEAVDTNLIYTFEINIAPKSEEEVKKTDRTRMKKSVTKGICNSSKRFMDAQISISYKYINSITKSKLFQFDVNQKDCYKLYGTK